MISQPSPGVDAMKKKRLEDCIAEHSKPILEAKFHEIDMNTDDDPLYPPDDAVYSHHGLSINMARLAQHKEEEDTEPKMKKEDIHPSPSTSLSLLESMAQHPLQKTRPRLLP